MARRRGAIMELNEKLKKLRSERGISQQVLADAIFVSRSAVAK
jgi:transcriptional regulator with XRE-family HTH domain